MDGNGIVGKEQARMEESGKERAGVRESGTGGIKWQSGKERAGSKEVGGSERLAGSGRE